MKCQQVVRYSSRKFSIYFVSLSCVSDVILQVEMINCLFHVNQPVLVSFSFSISLRGLKQAEAKNGVSWVTRRELEQQVKVTVLFELLHTNAIQITNIFQGSVTSLQTHSGLSDYARNSPEKNQ